MQASFKAVVVWFVLIAGISIFPVKVWALPEEVFIQFLDQGRWSEKADDNIIGENLSSDLIKRIVIDYRTQMSVMRRSNWACLLWRWELPNGAWRSPPVCPQIQPTRTGKATPAQIQANT